MLLEIVRLSSCKEGDTVRLKKIEGEGAFKKRLSEMGLIKGEEITVHKYAPLRDPMELVIKGYHLSLRVEEANNLVVQVLKTAKP